MKQGFAQKSFYSQGVYQIGEVRDSGSEGLYALVLQSSSKREYSLKLVVPTATVESATSNKGE